MDGNACYLLAFISDNVIKPNYDGRVELKKCFLGWKVNTLHTDKSQENVAKN